MENKRVSLFGEEFEKQDPKRYNQAKLKNDLEMLKYLKQFIRIEEEAETPYKHKLGFYKKKGHYINGKKVNRQIYSYIKDWLNN